MDPRRFDENRPKYIHGCCHIRTVAMAIAFVQMFVFVFDLGDLMCWMVAKKTGAVYYMEQGTTQDGQKAPFYSALHWSSDDGNSNTNNFWISDFRLARRQQNWAIMAAMLWDTLFIVSIIFMVYGIKMSKPSYMLPKIIADAMVALGGVYAVSSVLFLILADEKMFSGARAVFFASLFAALASLYVFSVSTRCFKFVREKRAALDNNSGPWSRVYIVPGQNFDVYDTPPDYSSVEKGVGVKAQQNSTTEEDKLPTYDEAKQLQNEKNH